MSISPYDIVMKPVITEQSMERVSEKRYVFQVAKTANKIEIRQAVEAIFGVKVASVNTMNCMGKMKRMGVHRGRRPSWKKAIVQLREESKGIEFFEGMV